jgi:hypothetical protein
MVRARYLNSITLPPMEVASVLKGAEIGKYVVIKSTAQSSCIVTADIKRLPLLMTGIAFTFYT